jgi:hypothetical protein
MRNALLNSKPRTSTSFATDHGVCRAASLSRTRFVAVRARNRLDQQKPAWWAIARNWAPAVLVGQAASLATTQPAFAFEVGGCSCRPPGPAPFFSAVHGREPNSRANMPLAFTYHADGLQAMGLGALAQEAGQQYASAMLNTVSTLEALDWVNSGPLFAGVALVGGSVLGYALGTSGSKVGTRSVCVQLQVCGCSRWWANPVTQHHFFALRTLNATCCH